MVNQDYIKVILGDDCIYLNKKKMLSALRELRGACISSFLAIAIANARGEHITQRDISTQTGYCSREVSRAIKRLRALGLIPEKESSNYSPSKKQPISSKLRWEVWERDNFTCRMCGARTHLSVDHIHPESAGGATELINLQTLCRSCNGKKGTRIIEDE
jgi:DNA-binding transcriptional ArsR family regulator